MTLLLTRSDVADLLPMDACIEAVEHAFKLQGEGRADPSGILSIHGRDGSFHIKAGILDIGWPYFAAKTNTNFPGNPEDLGLPTIQGVLLLAEAERGTPLALMDSAEITALRTGAATAVAARHLAPGGRSGHGVRVRTAGPAPALCAGRRAASHACLCRRP